jgi:hypothetical protein
MADKKKADGVWIRYTLGPPFAREIGKEDFMSVGVEDQGVARWNDETQRYQQVSPLAAKYLLEHEQNFAQEEGPPPEPVPLMQQESLPETPPQVSAD